ncbi:MAG TPA: hypothetical protein VMV92_16950 [Streptosporangiaceae bacterium]|nr:hypothetical protein [Streptosporangiaceae bacterium]
MIVLPGSKAQTYLVVSQCCTIENQIVAALAPVRSTRSLNAEQLSEYEREEPSVDPDVRYVYNAHALVPFSGYLTRTDGRIFVADLTSIQSYSGTISDFQESRVAMMTPAGRRLLRIRLALFWGRVEQEDELWFEERGLPSGPSQQRPQAESPQVPGVEEEAGAADGTTAAMGDGEATSVPVLPEPVQGQTEQETATSAPELVPVEPSAAPGGEGSADDAEDEDGLSAGD